MNLKVISGIFCLFVGLALCAPVLAQPPEPFPSPKPTDRYIPPSPLPRPSDASGKCDETDLDCRLRIRDILWGPRFGDVEVEGGIRFGDDDLDGAVRFAATGAQLNAPELDLSLIVFEAIYVPEAGGFRVRVTVAKAEAAFFCANPKTNKIQFPSFLFACKPEGAVALGAKLGEFQWDEITKRLGVRVAELNFIYNFLQNGNHRSFLQRKLMMFLGLDLEVIKPLDQDVRPIGRAHMGITGMLRSNNNRWEINGFVGYRPSLTHWVEDWAIETRVMLMHYLLFHKNVAGSIGVDAQYSHWSVPKNSIGAFADDEQRNSIYVGFLFGVKFQGF